MLLRRLALCTASLLLILGWASLAQAQFSVVSGGGQLQIGGGLPLPIQTIPTTGGTMMSPVTMGTVFPALLIPPASPAVTFPQGTMGTLTLPPGVLSAPAVGNAIGVFGQNPTLHQVGTTLGWTWPKGGAVLAPGGRTGAPVTTIVGPGGLSTITYTAGPAQFGGPARFAIAYGPNTGGGRIPGSPVTVWAIGGSPPPCTHPIFGGVGAGCVAALLPAYPASTAAVGNSIGFFTSTIPAGKPLPGIMLIKANAAGSLLASTFTPAMTMSGLTNMASSSGFPFTSGMLTVTAMAAGASEIFMLTGMDTRTTMGAGNISLVAGSLSQRLLSGPNANRGWISLTLPEPTAVVGAAGALAMLALCHGIARRRSR